MNRDEDDELSEAQRLSMLEETVSTNRVALVVMALLVVIGVSVAVTVAVVKIMQPDVSYVNSHQFSRLEKDVAILKEAAIAYDQSLRQAREVLDSSNATTFKTLMLEQEQSYQKHLQALKQGMRDLARMTPGSRTWLEIYDEQMDQALAASKGRMERLARIQTSELPVLDAVPLTVRPAPVNVTAPAAPD